jgi:hypothetical protein
LAGLYGEKKMSDLSRSEQSFALAALTPAEGGLAAPRAELAADEMWLQPLAGPRELAGIEHLRRQIELPASVRADPAFTALEKKEIRAGWWRHSGGATSPSEH